MNFIKDVFDFESMEMNPPVRPGGPDGSKRGSRSSLGSIKDMGLKQKIIERICFFMKRNSRLGVFLSLELITELIGVVTLVSAIVMLIKIGFPLQAVILLLLSVSFTTKRGMKFFLFLIKNLFSTLVSQSSSCKPREPRSSELRVDPENG